jgi:hypothetical protein
VGTLGRSQTNPFWVGEVKFWGKFFGVHIPPDGHFSEPCLRVHFLTGVQDHPRDR